MIFSKSFTLNCVRVANTASWLITLSKYLATERDIPKKRTITIATVNVSTGGCADAMVINHPLEIIRPVPPIKAKAPKITAAGKVIFVNNFFIDQLASSAEFSLDPQPEKDREL
jgi:hypothetical protein